MTPAKKEYYKFKAESDAHFGGLMPEIHEYVEELETELAALRERTRRISVQERPPEHEDTVIAFTDGDYPEISIFYNGKFTFRDYGYSSEIQRVTHWQPLHDGPEVKP